MSAKRVSVLGSGSWGTALATHLKLAGHEVCVWGIVEEDLKNISENQSNPAYFPGLKLEKGISTTSDLSEAVKKADCIVMAVPSFAVREVSSKLKTEVPVVIVSKGLEEGTLKFLSDVVAEETGKTDRIAVLSGPSFAKEVLEKKTTAVTVACKNPETLEFVCNLFHHSYFRTYRSEDLAGVQLGGAVKNVIALAVGICDGKDMGLNGRAALITRGLAEIGRLVKAMGGKAETISGLSGLGDLLLTATGDLSRNRRVGILLGEGKSLEEAIEQVGQTAEGVVTAPKILELAEKTGVDMPITRGVVAMLEGRVGVEEIVKGWLERGGKYEIEDKNA